MRALYVASVVAANVMTARLGLVSIGLGLTVTAGTFAAGATLVLRDGVQARSRHWVEVPVLILAAAAVSAITASPALALASGLAFLVGEGVDWLVFTRTVPRGVPAAVLLSSVISAPVDTVMFLAIAGFPVTWQAVAGQWLVKTGVALVAALWLARPPRW